MRKLLLAAALTVAVAQAQSLKPNTPAALQAGINRGTIDSLVGTHYWFFTASGGKIHVKAQFKAMGLLGNPQKTTITVTVADAGHSWSTPRTLTSDVKPAEVNFEGDVKPGTKVLVNVAPPPGALVRMGGDYTLEATGAVAFAPKGGDPVVQTYKCGSGWTSDLGAVKFNADGTLVTVSGAKGTWQLFDADSHTYVLNVEGQPRKTLQYVAGRGFCEGEIIVLQELK